MRMFPDGITEIDMAKNRRLIRWCMPEYAPDDEYEQEAVNYTLAPTAGSPLFPGLLGDMVAACCDGNDTPPVAVAATLLAMFGASIGRLRYVEDGNIDIWLTPWLLLAGPTGCGKGVSLFGPRRIFAACEDHLFDACERARDAGQFTDNWSPLAIHTGGLSSGEGLAWMLRDEESEKDPAVTDKRILIVEDEMANVMDQCLRAGNTLSPRLRSAANGVDMAPATRRDRLRATAPHIAMVGHITEKELLGHEAAVTSLYNGLLNRFMLLSVNTPDRMPWRKRTTQAEFAQLGETLAGCIIRARGSFETHWRKQKELTRPVTFSDACIPWWERYYSRYTGDYDCPELSVLRQRHRTFVFRHAALFALLDNRDVIEPFDMHTACLWCNYSTASAVQVFSLTCKQRETRRLNTYINKILLGMMNHDRVNLTMVYRWFNNKIKKDVMDAVLKRLFSLNPPLIREVSQPGDKTRWFTLTDYGRKGQWPEVNDDELSP